jgi:F-type H+-transporting ATPase subunit b
LENLGLNLGYLILQALMFGILFVVLRAWVYKPILGLLERRRTAIAQGLEDARIAAEARSKAESEANQVLAEAQSRATHVIREATERAEAVQLEIRNQAEAEAGKAREVALSEVHAERDRILGELRGQVAALAIAAAQKIIGESLDAQRQRTLINEFFSGVKSGKVVVLDGSPEFNGSSAEVISALPLTPEEQETVRQDVLRSLGGVGTVAFLVDPAILGGLVVRVGDKVLDGSVAGQLTNLKQTLR